MTYDAILADKFYDMMLENEEELDLLARKMSEKALEYFKSEGLGLEVEEK